MKNDGTFKIGNKISLGKEIGSKSRAQRFFSMVGESTAQSLLDLHTEEALKGDKGAQQFLINKFLPDAKPEKFITIDAPVINDIKDILPAQNFILQEQAKGTISIEVGEKLFNEIELMKKTIEMCDLAKQVEEIRNEINLRKAQP